MSKLRDLMRAGFAIPYFHRWEAFFIRLFTAVAIFLTIPGPTKPIPDKQDYPVGLAHVIDLTFYANPAFTGPGPEKLKPAAEFIGLAQVPSALQFTVFALLILYVAGRLLWLSLPALTLIHISLFALFNSQGDTNHNRQIVSMVLVAQCIVVLWPHFYLLFRREKLRLPPGRQLSHYMIFFSQQAVVGIYVISALTKLIRSKGLWIFQTPDLAVDLVKTHDQDFYSDLKLDGGLELESVIAFMADHPLLTILIFAPGFFLELFAFAALYNRAAGLIIGVSLVVMHELISSMFHLHFGENELIVLIYLVNVPFWIYVAGKKFGRFSPLKGGSKADAPDAGLP